MVGGDLQMWLAKALREWHEFYILLGTAGATLLALLFVALSVGVGYLRVQRAANIRTFMSPVVIHFAAVFFISAIALVPGHRAEFFAVIIVLTGLVGIAVSGAVTIGVLKSKVRSVDVIDCFAYGFLPAAAYAALIVAAGMIIAEVETASLDILGGALLLLLIVNVRNAWDLTLAMVHKHASHNAG